MTRPWRPAVLILLASLFCSPLFAYQLAFKDGRIVQFQRYRVETGKFIYTDDAGKEVSVALSDVDLERTRTLNSKESPPLDLSAATPGATPSGNAAAGRSAGEAEPASLGDAVRDLRKQGKAHAAGQKRTYTDDDMQPAAGGALPVLKPAADEKKPAAGSETQKNEAKKEKEEDEVSEQWFSEYYELGREETARDILAYAKLPPDTPFADRAEWESRLFEAKKDMIQAYMHSKAHPQDEGERETLRQKWNAFATIANEGIKKAQLHLQVHPSN